MRLLLAIPALAGARGMAVADAVSLPGPPIAVAPHSFSDAAAGRNFKIANGRSVPTPCDKRLARLAAVTSLAAVDRTGRLRQPRHGRGQGGAAPRRAPHRGRAAGVLNCAMAESLAAWLREEAAPRVTKLGSALTAIENYDSYECRIRNRVPGAKLSEHVHGDALDARALHLADGRRLQLTDAHVDKALRMALRDSACHRFTTVLGPGVDGHNMGLSRVRQVVDAGNALKRDSVVLLGDYFATLHFARVAAAMGGRA